MKIVSLGEICDLQNGYAFKSSDYVSFSNTLNCRMSNVRPNGKFDVEYAPKYLPDDYANTYSNFLLKDGDIVIAMTDMANDPKILGVPTIVDTKGKNMLLNQRVGKLILLKENQVNISYLQYSLNRTSVKKYYTQFAGGGLQLNVGKKEILSVKIPLPPLETQQKIASILDAADTLRQKDKALLAKYDELTQALFLDMFGDPVSNPMGWKLKEGSKYYEVRGRVGWKGYKKTDLRQTGAIVLGATHINNLGIIDLSKVVYLSEEKYIESPEIMVQKFDLIFVQRGNTIGKIALVRSELGDATINPVVLIFRPLNSNPYFLLYLLMNKGLNREFVASNSGSAQPMITQKTMKEYLMIDVPLSLQNHFAERVAIIEQQKAIAQASLEKSEELFNSLLQKAFKGEISNVYNLTNCKNDL